MHIVLLKASAKPFVAGLYTVEYCHFILYFSGNLYTLSFFKLVPLSDWILYGIPNQRTMLMVMNIKVASAVTVFKGTTSAQREK